MSLLRSGYLFLNIDKFSHHLHKEWVLEVRLFCDGYASMGVWGQRLENIWLDLFIVLDRVCCTLHSDPLMIWLDSEFLVRKWPVCNHESNYYKQQSNNSSTFQQFSSSRLEWEERGRIVSDYKSDSLSQAFYYVASYDFFLYKGSCILAFHPSSHTK